MCRCRDAYVGPLPDDSPILRDFRAELKREGIAGESFVLKKDTIPAPRNRRVETVSGIKLTFPATLPGSMVAIDRVNGQIIIHDEITIDDVDLDRTPRARS